MGAWPISLQNAVPARYTAELKTAFGIRNTPSRGSQQRKAGKLGTAWPCFSIPNLFDLEFPFC